MNKLFTMKKIILLIVLLLAVCFVAGCTKEEQVNGTTEEQTNETAEEQAPAGNQASASGLCEPKWKCISSNIKAFQLENCSFTDRKECPLGCFNDTCKIKEACVSGFKCKGETIKAFQTEGCYWMSETRCDWKCVNGECIPRPENATEDEAGEEAASATPTAPVAVTPENRLALGETKTITKGGVDYELSIYIIEDGRVRLKLGAQKSDWLAEGEKASFLGGNVSIAVEEILFQPYDGGVKAVVWEEG